MGNSSPSNRVVVEASRVIHAPVERVWAEVANFNSLASWHPDVIECEGEGQEVGADAPGAGSIRVLKLRNGAVVRERLVDIDPERHRYVYSVLDGQLPLKGHLSSVTMQVVGADHTKVTWEASFEPAGAPPDALADAIRTGVIELGLDGLAKRVRQAD